MQVCICGWYFLKECLGPLSTQQDIWIVGHRLGETLSIPFIKIENIGLEFHCYDYFVKNVWDKTSQVLFCHDDIKIKDISILDDLEKEISPIVMVWSDEKQYKRNLAHGRMFKCSPEFLSQTKGFWYDVNNTGCIDASKGCNNAIGLFYQSTKSVTKHFFTDKLEMGFRGKL